MTVHKLTFQEAWNSATIFYVDEELENQIDAEVSALIQLSQTSAFSSQGEITIESLTDFIKKHPEGLDVILKDIGLSEEKFLRIVSLLRKIGRIPGEFDREWNLAKIKQQLSTDQAFLATIVILLFDGKSDTELSKHIPRYYLHKLNYREIALMPQSLRKIKYKDALIGTYGAQKGHRVEAKIREFLEQIRSRFGVGFESGRSRFIHVDMDFAIPSLQDPWVIVMSSFQETTSSGQTTKARDMLTAYTRINESNSRFGENRAFVNFVDGGGWLARRRDFERLVHQCHYFINLHYLPMLEEIILRHVPRSFFSIPPST